MVAKNWFMPIKTVANPTQNIICFPWGGGAASAFMPWRQLKSAVNIWALKLPGRESRIDEPLLTSAQECVDNILPALPFEFTLPTLFYGHSMGAGLAMHTYEKLHKRQSSLPKKIIASGRMPPHYAGLNPVSAFNDDELLHYLMQLNSAQHSISNDKNFLRQYLPKMRADYQLNSTIYALPRIKRPLAISIINGHGDTLLDHSKLVEWGEHTHYPLTTHFIPGGHFFMRDRFSVFMDLIDIEINSEVTSG